MVVPIIAAKTTADQPQEGRGGAVQVQVPDQNQIGVGYKYKIPECSKCVVCGSQVTNLQIKVLPCLHSICSDICLEKNENKHGDKCPCCFRVYEKDGKEFMARDFLLELMGDELELEKKNLFDSELCTYCVRNEKASCWCQDCSLFLCSYCQENHKFQIMTRGHVIKDKSCGEPTITSPDFQDNECKLHKNQALILYCKSCEALICSLEKHPEHNDKDGVIHEVETIQEIVTNYRKTLEDKLLEVKNIADATEEGAKALFDLEAEILTTRRDEYFHKVKQSLVEIINELIRLEMNVRRNAVEESVLRSKNIKGKGIIYESLSRRALQYYEYGNTILEQGSQWSLFRHIFGADSQFKEIKEEYNILSNQVNIEGEKALDFQFDDVISKDIISKIKSMSKVFYGEKLQMGSMIREDTIKNSKAKNGGSCTGAGAEGVNIFTESAKNPHMNKSDNQQLSPRQNSLKPAVIFWKKDKKSLSNNVKANDNDNKPAVAVRGDKEKISEVRNENKSVGSIPVNVDNCGVKVTTPTGNDAEKSLNLRKRKTNDDDVTNPNPEIEIEIDPKQKTRRKQSLNTLTGEPEFLKKNEELELNPDNSAWLNNIGNSKSTSTAVVVQPALQKEGIITSIRLPKRSPRFVDKMDGKTLPINGPSLVKEQTTSALAPSTATDPHSLSNKRSRGVSVEETSHSSSKNPAKRKVAPEQRKSATPRRARSSARYVQEESDEDPEIDSDGEEIGELNVPNDDQNDDFCFVCRGGGNNLLCCDVCPKIFHLHCHIPPFTVVPTVEPFQCLFCAELEHILKLFPDYNTMVKANQLMKKELLICFKFLCEIYKIQETKYVRSAWNAYYLLQYKKDATDLDMVRSQLCLGKPKPFESAKDVVMMIRKAFYQATNYYDKDTKEYLETVQSEKKFEQLVGEYYPELQGLKYTPDENDLNVAVDQDKDKEKK